MHDTPLTVLLVEDNPGDARLLRESLAEDVGDAIHLLWVHNLSAALEEVRHEIVDAIILDLNLPDCGGLDTFVRMRDSAPDIPLLVLTGLEDDQIGLRAIQEGAQDYLAKSEATGGKVARSLRYAVERHRSRLREVNRMNGAMNGKVVGFIGAKGGVGVTTVTLNVAALMARNTQRSVAAVELHPDFGSFAPMLHESPEHTLATLFRLDMSTITESVIDKCVVRSRFGFDLLFSPQSPCEYVRMDPDAARRIVERISRRVAYLLVDLPAASYPATAGALAECDYLVMMTERDPASIAAAHRTLLQLRETESGCPPTGLVVVNRALIIDGMPPKQIESHLGCELLGVVPPAPEVSVSAQRSGTPIALHRPLSAPATMLTSITERVARAVSDPKPKRAQLEVIPA